MTQSPDQSVIGEVKVVMWTVQPSLVLLDADGDLTPIQAPPINIPAKRWPEVIELCEKQLEQIRQQFVAPVDRDS